VKARKWYRGLTTGSISNLQQFHQVFVSHWEIKKNPLQILVEYESLRRYPGDSVQGYLQEIQFKIIQIGSIRFIIIFQYK